MLLSACLSFFNYISVTSTFDIPEPSPFRQILSPDSRILTAYQLPYHQNDAVGIPSNNLFISLMIDLYQLNFKMFNRQGYIYIDLYQTKPSDLIIHSQNPLRYPVIFEVSTSRKSIHVCSQVVLRNLALIGNAHPHFVGSVQYSRNYQRPLFFFFLEKCL